MTRISVMRNKFVGGWPRHAEGERVYVRSLSDVLERAFSTDAHFTAYRSPNGRRLTREALDQGVAVELTCIVFDVDCPDTHGSKEPAPESWRRDLRGKVSALFDAHGAGYYYETKGGARILYRQEEPTIIRTQDEARQWSQAYAVAVAHLEHRFGIVADSACSDWQRLYRLPRATREAGAKPENWPTFGNVNAIGSLLIDATHADVDAAKGKSNAFADRSRAMNFDTPGRVDAGLLFWLLRMRGDVGQPGPRGGWICRCPNRSEHSVKTDGTDSTVVFPARDGGELGQIACLHGHCKRFSPKDWLRFFSNSELDNARERAGIKRTAA